MRLTSFQAKIKLFKPYKEISSSQEFDRKDVWGKKKLHLSYTLFGITLSLPNRTETFPGDEAGLGDNPAAVFQTFS